MRCKEYCVQGSLYLAAVLLLIELRYLKLIVTGGQMHSPVAMRTRSEVKSASPAHMCLRRMSSVGGAGVDHTLMYNHVCVAPIYIGICRHDHTDGWGVYV